MHPNSEMSIIGIIRGIGPESTIEYYRRIIESYRHRLKDRSYPHIIINSIDLSQLLELAGSARRSDLIRFLQKEVRRLAAGGAELGAFAANTPHIVFEEVQQKSPIPLVSIVESVCNEVKQLGFKKVGLFGTRFTMEGDVYSKVFSREGITVVLPIPEERDAIHEAYINELLANVFRPKTRQNLLSIAKRMKEEDAIQGVILGGTELPPLFQHNTRPPVPFLDTANIHVRHILARALEGKD
jgi:aspartate racemase